MGSKHRIPLREFMERTSLNHAQVAQLFKVAPTTVYQLWGRTGIPAHRRDQVKSYYRFLHEQSESHGETPSEVFMKALRQHTIAVGAAENYRRGPYKKRQSTLATSVVDNLTTHRRANVVPADEHHVFTAAILSAKHLDETTVVKMLRLYYQLADA